MPAGPTFQNERVPGQTEMQWHATKWFAGVQGVHNLPDRARRPAAEAFDRTLLGSGTFLRP